VEEREGVAFGEAVTDADAGGFAQRGGALLQVSARVPAVELGQASQRDSQVVESDAARDLALVRSPGKRALEERYGFGEVLRRRAEVGERCPEVMQDAGVPAALLVVPEVGEGGGESFACPRQVGGRAGASEKDGDVVKETRPVLFGVEGKLPDSPRSRSSSWSRNQSR
jgi:hypothetical protein